MRASSQQLQRRAGRISAGAIELNGGPPTTTPDRKRQSVYGIGAYLDNSDGQAA